MKNPYEVNVFASLNDNNKIKYSAKSMLIVLLSLLVLLGLKLVLIDSIFPEGAPITIEYLIHFTSTFAYIIAVPGFLISLLLKSSLDSINLEEIQIINSRYKKLLVFSLIVILTNIGLFLLHQ